MADDFAITTFDDLIRRGILAIGDGYRAKLEELGGDGPIFLRAGLVSDTHVSFDDAERFHQHLASKVANKMSKTGDVVITTKGNSTGRVAYVDDSMPAFVYSPHLSYWRSLNLDVLSPGYLRYWSRGDEFQRQLRGFSTSTDMAPYLSLVDQKRLTISLPAIEEQRAIAHILGTLDDKIELNRRMNETLESIAQAIFKSWFVDFDPVRAKASGEPPESICRRLGLTPELLAHFPDRLVDSELGEVPEGWEVRSLSTLAALDTTSTSPATRPDDMFEHYSIPAFDNSAMPAYELGSSIKSNKYVVSPRAVLVSKLNPETPRVWMPAVKTQRAVCSTEFMQFVPHLLQRRTYVYLMMCSDRMQAQILMRVTGSTGSRQRAQPSQVANLAVLMPADTVIESFDVLAAPILELVARNREQTQTLAEVRDSLLPKLLSGELRVPLKGAA
jgi:type I restriction enzyme S subunit